MEASIREYFQGVNTMGIKANDALTISPAGIALIKKWEGWYPKAYKDPVGVWTIGWGTTGVEARPGRTITKKQGDEFLRRDLKDDEDSVRRLVKVPLTQYQFDSLVSFVYNAGSGNLSRSTLLRLLNRGNYSGAASQFIRWNKARSRETGEWLTLNGLTARRKDEAALFMRSANSGLTAVEMSDKDEDLADPQNYDGNVHAEAPTDNDGALMQILKGSDTIKAVGIALTGLITAMGSLLDKLAENPTTIIALGVGAVGILAVVYVKYRDTREGR